jgi:flagellar motor switch protein FliG
MNRADVIREVSTMSGENPETCDRVLKALQKVLQRELGTSKGLGAIVKIQSLFKHLSSELKD